MDINTIAIVLLATIAYMVAGYLKDKYKKGEKFEYKKAVPTILVGICVAATTTVLGISVDTAVSYIEMFLAVFGVNSAIDKTIFGYLR